MSKANDFVTAVLDAVNDALEGDALSTLPERLDALSKAFETPPTPTAPIVKGDQRMVWGWANVSREDGGAHFDTQGDYLPIDEIRQAAHAFMSKRRHGKDMHTGRPDAATIVESLVLDTELQKALGVDLGREGWFIGAKVHSDAYWNKVKSGEYTGFSIGGSGTRVPVAKSAPTGVRLFGDLLPR